MSNRIVIAFVPVLHAGYVKFFRNHVGAQLRILAKDVYQELEQLTREIRAMKPTDTVTLVKALGIFQEVSLITSQDIYRLPSDIEIVMPDEDISRLVQEKFLPNHKVTFEPVFLRYDLPNTFKQHAVTPDSRIVISDLDRRLMGVASCAALRSPDWWRQVGAALVKNSVILGVAYNKHMPSQHSLYALGDPRNNFSPGEHLDISAAQHAEKVLIARAAKNGDSTDGAYIYASTFPCGPCAYDIVTAGISRVYYSDGYSSLQAQELFKLAKVEIVHVADN